VASETSFDAMKSNSSTNYKHWDTYGLRNPGECEFMRKGEVGDHKNRFDEEMDEIISKWISGHMEKYPIILKSTTMSTNETLNETEKCCSLQNTDPTQT